MNNRAKFIVGVIAFLLCCSLYKYVYNNTWFYVAALVLFYKYILRAFQTGDRKIKRYAAAFAILFSMLYTAGNYLDKYDSLHLLLHGNYFKSVFAFLAQTILFYVILTVIFKFFSGKEDKQLRFEIREMYLPVHKKYFFIAAWGIIFLCWIPY